MTQINYLIILILMIGMSKIGNCAEFASQWQETPKGNEICKERWNSEYIIGIKCKHHKIEGIKYGHIITNLTKWYFYKNQIIGEFINENEIGFFIFDELSCEKQLFKDKNKFENQLKELNLKPKIWTRWYHSYWGMIFTSGDFGEGIYFTFIKLPILIITPIVTLIGLIRTKFDIKHKFNKISLTILGLIIGRILLDILPNSI